jgi:hypothetical protein
MSLQDVLDGSAVSEIEKAELISALQAGDVVGRLEDGSKRVVEAVLLRDCLREVRPDSGADWPHGGPRKRSPSAAIDRDREHAVMRDVLGECLLRAPLAVRYRSPQRLLTRRLAEVELHHRDFGTGTTPPIGRPLPPSWNSTSPVQIPG